MDQKTKYRKEYYLKNKKKLIEYGKKYNERIYPKVKKMMTIFFLMKHAQLSE